MLEGIGVVIISITIILSGFCNLYASITPQYRWNDYIIKMNYFAVVIGIVVFLLLIVDLIFN